MDAQPTPNEAEALYQQACALRGQDGEGGQPADRACPEAVPLLRRAADLDHPKAQYELGMLYLRGQGVPQDEATARRWLTRAAAKDRTFAGSHAQGELSRLDEAAAQRGEGAHWRPGPGFGFVMGLGLALVFGPTTTVLAAGSLAPLQDPAYWWSLARYGAAVGALNAAALYLYRRIGAAPPA